MYDLIHEKNLQKYETMFFRTPLHDVAKKVKREYNEPQNGLIFMFFKISECKFKKPIDYIDLLCCCRAEKPCNVQINENMFSVREKQFYGASLYFSEEYDEFVIFFEHSDNPGKLTIKYDFIDIECSMRNNVFIEIWRKLARYA